MQFKGSSHTGVRAIVFDLDDTLYPESEYVLSGYKAAASMLGDAAEAQLYTQWLWQRFTEGRSAGAFDVLNDTFNLHLSPGRIAELVKAYREHSPTISPFEGMVDLLVRLKGAGMKLGLLSDGYQPGQRLKLDALGVGGSFDTIIFTEDIGRSAWKPSPLGFRAVAHRLATAHAQCVYVADNPSKDFVAPNSLGWLTIRLIHPRQVHSNLPTAQGGEPQLVAHSPAELEAALLHRR